MVGKATLRLVHSTEQPDSRARSDQIRQASIRAIEGLMRNDAYSYRWRVASAL